MANRYDQKVLEDKAYEDAKNDNFNPPHDVNVITDLINSVTPLYDKSYIENHEYRKLYDEAKDAIKK